MSRANAQWVLDNAKGDMLPRDLYERARWLAHDHLIALGNLEEAQRDVQLQNRRAEFAKYVVPGLLPMVGKWTADEGLTVAQQVARAAVMYADALIRELQRTGPDVPTAAMSFDELWALYEKAGFSYGEHERENVRFGFEIARGRRQAMSGDRLWAAMPASEREGGGYKCARCGVSRSENGLCPNPACELADKARAEWDRPGEYNACTRCTFSPDKGASCAHHEVVTIGTIPTALARSPNGACGVEAQFLSFPGLEPAGERVRAVYAEAQGFASPPPLQRSLFEKERDDVRT